MVKLILALSAGFIIVTADCAMAGDRIGHVRGSTPNQITEVRETVKDGKTVYVVTHRPSGATYQAERVPEGTVWQ